MPLNREGVEQLKADLRANARHYTQESFGKVTPECGTEACMAGMCLMRRMGIDEFTKLAKAAKGSEFSSFVNDCLDAAVKQLGLDLLSEAEYFEIAGQTEDGEDLGDGFPPIFSAVGYWPSALRDAYAEAELDHDHAAMAEVACRALDRIDDNGVFVAA